jgi:hypothetical protein
MKSCQILRHPLDNEVNPVPFATLIYILPKLALPFGQLCQQRPDGRMASLAACFLLPPPPSSALNNHMEATEHISQVLARFGSWKQHSPDNDLLVTKPLTHLLAILPWHVSRGHHARNATTFSGAGLTSRSR